MLTHVTSPKVRSIPGMSQAVRTDRPLLFVSGQVALDVEGAIVGRGDFEAQVHQVMSNLAFVLESGGGSLDKVVKLGIFLTDLRHLEEWRSLRANYLSSPFPASTLVVVDSLIIPDLLIEVEAIAEVNPQKM